MKSFLEGDVRIGYATTLGEGCVLRGSVSVGNYSQFAPRVSLFARAHPFDHITIYVNNVLLGGRMKDFQPHDPVTVGNDVWIGCGAVVLRGVRVGDGAVIGAGSVVTRDVPDYAIVAGSPAKLLRMRFDEEVIRYLIELKWWEMTVDELASFEDIFTVNLNEDGATAIDVLKECRERKKEVIRQRDRSSDGEPSKSEGD